MAVNVIDANNAFANGGTGTRKAGDTLGKDEFLKLMIAQMQNQDPLDPKSDTEFVAQLAQFSTLEQMLNMNTTMSLNAATSLIGAEVQWTDSAGNVLSGTVTAARMYNGAAQVMVGDTAIDVSKVSVVQATPTSSYLSYISLVGTNVSWIDNAGKVQTGTVDGIIVNADGSINLSIGDQIVNVSRVVSIKSPQTTISEEMYQALLLIGSTVTWKDENGTLHTDKVNQVRDIDGKPWLAVGDNNTLITMDQIEGAESGTNP